MKIFTAAQIKSQDAFTIQHEPVSAADLMERAAKSCASWLIQHVPVNYRCKIFCGKGNNGGDGLAIARLLIEHQFSVEVYIIDSPKKGTEDFERNARRLENLSATVLPIKADLPFPDLQTTDIIIDAVLGTGLNKKPGGVIKQLIGHLNRSGAKIISIDVPSGLYVDQSSVDNTVVRAAYTLSFQQAKLAFLMPENASFFGKVVTLDIGLSKEFYDHEKSAFELTDEDDIRRIYQSRDPFANKGNFGHACLVTGSYGMMGAAVLSARACLRSGVGKLTCYTCREGYAIIQGCVPEAMCMTFGNSFIKDIDTIKNFDVTGVGPGIGRHLSHKQLLQKVFRTSKGPVVVDADAINVLSNYDSLYHVIPENSILTPHPKEFERLFGKTENDFDTADLALRKAKELRIIIVLKGHRTLVAAPSGEGYFNSTGNAGMATAGSGDVLTGILTGLLAQKYSPLDACILGVYLHGLAGDIAAQKLSQEALLAGDLIDNLGDAFKAVAYEQKADVSAEALL